MWSDLRHGLRAVVQAPLLHAVVIASLAVGIGVNVAVFSWVEVFALTPLPGVPRAAEFHLVEPRSDTGGNPGASWREFLDLREALAGVADAVAFRMAPLNIGDPGRTERAFALLVSGRYFDALGVAPTLGRVLTPADVARPGSAPVAVVSQRFWQSRLAADPAALGRAIRVNGAELSVVGVLPDGFQGTVLGLQFDLWVPATMAPVVLGGSRELEDRRTRGYTVMARLPRADQVAAASAIANRTMATLAEQYPESNRGVGVDVLAYWQAPRGPQRMFLQALGVLQGLMLLLLAAVCGNTATLLLARSTARQRELAIRLALGASPWRVARLLFAEAAVVGVLGAVAGTLLAAWGVAALRVVPLTTGLPIRFQTTVDWLGAALAIALGLASAALVGLLPAVQVLRLDVTAGVGAGARTTAPGWWRSLAIAAEVALAMVVLVVAGLFLGSFADTRATDPGFRREGVLLAAYDRSATGGTDDAAAMALLARMLERLEALPGVEGAASATAVPLDIHGLPRRAFVVEGRPRTDGVVDRAASNIVTPGYFAVMGLPMIAGSGFVPLDDRTAPPQVVVNEAFVDRYLSDGAVIGRQLEQNERRHTISGVVATSLSDAFGEPPTPAIYFSYRDRPSRSGELHVRTRPGTEATLAGAVRSTVAALDPAAPVFNVRTLDEHVENNLLLKRIPARLFLVLGPLLLALAAGGIHAAVAYAVTARRGEIGVRLALGATGPRVVAEVMASSLSVVAAGAAAGWLLVWIVATRVVGVAADGRAFVAVPALLLAAAALSSWLPARRAAAVDPLETLRRE
jgi:predicted permease